MAKLLAGFAAYYTAARKSHTILVDDAGCRRGTTVDRGEGISYAHRGNRGARNLRRDPAPDEIHRGSGWQPL